MIQVIPSNIDTKRYLEAHEKVLSVMDGVRDGVCAEITDRICEGEVWTQQMKHIALEYAQAYAMRDVMTLMACGLPIEEAQAVWTMEHGPMSLEGAVIDSVIEAYEEFNEEEDE